MLGSPGLVALALLPWDDMATPRWSVQHAITQTRTRRRKGTSSDRSELVGLVAPLAATHCSVQHGLHRLVVSLGWPHAAPGGVPRLTYGWCGH
jgi:hypothetical protein